MFADKAKDGEKSDDLFSSISTIPDGWPLDRRCWTVEFECELRYLLGFLPTIGNSRACCTLAFGAMIINIIINMLIVCTSQSRGSKPVRSHPSKKTMVENFSVHYRRNSFPSVRMSTEEYRSNDAGMENVTSG